MNEQRARGCLIAAVIWCVILGLLGVAYKFLVHPHLTGKLQQATSGTSQYQTELTVAADSFSGYCILRSEALKQELKENKIRLTIQDDKADYAARLENLRSGKVQMAVFTIDSLVKAGAEAGDFPGSIVFVIDETRGADAIVALQGAMPGLQALSDPSARIVLTPNSPSEFLARVVLANFNLPTAPEKLFITADGAGAVYKQLLAARPTEKKAFALWEPYVSRALQQKGVHVLLDSSKLKGYVVDVLVARRQFLQDSPALARAFIEAYARAVYQYAQQPDGMMKLVMADARQTGADSLDESQARKLVEEIQWKNLLENYTHFGLVTGAGQGGLSSIEDMIANITDVLVKTRAIASDPLAGRQNTLYFDRILAELRADKFHPGRKLNLLNEVNPSGAETAVRIDRELPALAAEGWARLVPVGELRAASIAFKRASSEISLDSERDLQDLARRLKTFPLFYVRVIGHARAEGDPEANRILAQSRADSVATYLAGQGIPVQRIRAETSAPSSDGAEFQSVSFFVGQTPY
jgi:outer membrane protein OmpA-like peptidoglycan-associated protein/ABC-type nitrate/sulfonate/bicarbonate transport system substrate-binding protein